jgi:hypothetical protein
VDSRSTARAHVVVGVVVVLLLPLASWLDGSGQLAWTMFSRTGRYRLELISDGKPVNPTELAAFAAPGPTSSALAGADHFRHHDVARATLRRHLRDIAGLACKTRPGTTITARLHERVRSDAEIRTTEVTMSCDR